MAVTPDGGKLYVALPGARGLSGFPRGGGQSCDAGGVTSNGVKQINPVLASNHIQVIKDTHGKTSHLS